MSSLFRLTTSGRWIVPLLTLGIALLVTLSSSTPVAAECGTSGSPTVSTDKTDYAPGETVIITGSGYACGVTLTIKVTQPDGSVVVGDGSGRSGSDTVTADDTGAFTYHYVVAGMSGTHLVEVVDASGDVLATTRFTDSHFIIAISPGSLDPTWDRGLWSSLI